jgi:hypothetical protein
MQASHVERYVEALRALSPMPSDEALETDPERIDHYASVLQAIEDERAGTQGPLDCRIVAALIASFGPGDGFETYWSTVHLIESAQCAETERLTRLGLATGSVGTRKWCCLLVGRKRDPADLQLLLARLADPETLVVAEALWAIRMIACEHPIPDATAHVSALTTHPDPQITHAAHETLLLIRQSAS